MGGALSDHARVDVAAVINDSEIGRFQYLIFALCILIMMCDGFDTQALAYVAPSIASEWNWLPAASARYSRQCCWAAWRAPSPSDIWRTGSAASARCCYV